MAIVFVQSKGVDAGTVTSTTLVFTSNVTAGSMLLGSCRAGAQSETITISDNVNAGNYANDTTFSSSTDSNTGTIQSKLNASAGATTVTCALSASATLRFSVHEFSGVASSSALDQVNTGQGNSASPSAGNVTTTVANELLFVTAQSGLTQTYTAGTGYTPDQAVPAAPNSKHFTEYQIVSSTGTYAGNCTQSASTTWSAQIATYKAAGGNVTVALTGQSSATSTGTLALSSSVALSGQAGTSAIGSLTPNMDFALLGQSANSIAGVLSPATETALTGISASASPGTMSVPGASAAEVAAGRRTRHIYRVSIDGQSFEFRNYAQACAFLDQAQRLAQSLAPEKAQQALQQRSTPVLPRITANTRELRPVITQVKREIAKRYRDELITAELTMLFEIQARTEHNEESLLLLL